MSEMSVVRVTNANNVWKVRDKYGGIEYVLNPGETISMPSAAAEHIFGYGLPEKERFKKMMRMGIANHPKGPEMWSRIRMKAAGAGQNVAPTGSAREIEGKTEGNQGKDAA
jgi:hypothetical protein